MLELDKGIIESVLATYGFSLDDVLKGGKSKKPLAEQDWIYLIHHMHPPEKEEDMETLHHCFLFEKKNMKGKKYSQRHVKDKKVFQHVLDIKEKEVDDAPKLVFCHLNNSYKVRVVKINKKKWAVLKGPETLKDVKWSDQDKGNIGGIKNDSIS